MGVIDKLFGKKIESNINETFFVKDFSKENENLKELEQLSSRLKDGNKKNLIDRDIFFVKNDLNGESKVHFELKNSFLPALCLHDVRIEKEDYTAQMDYVIISSKYICVLKTKNLNGHIIINEDGDFIRIMEDKSTGEFKEQGMYSPIAQSQRHLDILKHLLVSAFNIDSRLPMETIAVMCNPKTVIEKNRAPKEIGDRIVRYDKLISTLKGLEDRYKSILTDEQIYNIADFLMLNHKPIIYDYAAKYKIEERDYLKQKVENAVKEKEIITDVCKESNEEALIAELKKYRLDKSKELDFKPYMIFSNDTMMDIVSNKPISKVELIAVKGFGDKKAEMYGQDIIEIVRKHKR